MFAIKLLTVKAGGKYCVLSLSLFFFKSLHDVKQQYLENTGIK